MCRIIGSSDKEKYNIVIAKNNLKSSLQALLTLTNVAALSDWHTQFCGSLDRFVAEMSRNPFAKRDVFFGARLCKQ